MQVGILGGTRFIGYHLVEALIARGIHVTIFNRGKTREPCRFLAPVKRIIGDRNRSSSLEPFFSQNFDAVIDLSGYQPHQVEPIARRWWTKVGHYLFCSTTSVYRQPPPQLFDETTPCMQGMGSYGGDKAAMEEMLLARAHQSNWPVTIFRPQGVLGPFRASQPLYVIRRLLSNRPVHLRYGTDGKKANFLSVHDLSRCFIQAMHDPKTFGQVFNVCCDQAITSNEFINLLSDMTKTDSLRPVLLNAEICREFSEMGLSWPSYDLVPSNQFIKNRLGVRFEPIRETLDKIDRKSVV